MTPHHPQTDALALLYEEHGAELYRYLLGMLGRSEDAEDVLQTVWAKLCGRLKRAHDPAAYLWRAARNEALSWRRSRGRRERGRLGEDALLLLPDDANPGVGREERLAVAAALPALSFEQREAVVLFAFEGMSAREAAIRLRTTENTAASRYRLAVAKLKRKLDRR